MASISLPSLNLPPARLDMRSTPHGVQIFDVLRGKWVALTPEEWVRQNFTFWLMDVKSYPRFLMDNEVGLTLNNTRRRCDTVVFSRTLHPLVVVEYKAPTVTITQKTFDQIARYNLVVKARYLIVSNGMRHFCCRYDGVGYEFVGEIPDYPDIAGDQQ